MRAAKPATVALVLTLALLAAGGAYGQAQLTAPKAINASLTVLSGEVRIWYFYLSTCPYCLRQEPILARLEQRYGIDIQPISLDGGAPQNRLFGGYKVNDGRAAKLGVHATPTLYLVNPHAKQAVQLSSGLMSAMQIKRRIVRAANKLGWIQKAVANKRQMLAQGTLSPDAGPQQSWQTTTPILDRLNELNRARR